MEFFIWLAILPSIIIAFIINKADKKEKEPTIELVKAFSMGFLAVVLTLLLSFLLGINHIQVHSNRMIEVAFYSFFAIAFIEEFCKWICAHLFLRKNKNFNYLFDGILYVTLVSLGFATIENILYTLQGGLTTVIVRAITTVPAWAGTVVRLRQFLPMLFLELLVVTTIHYLKKRRWKIIVKNRLNIS